MRARVAGSQLRVPGGAEGLLADLLDGRPRGESPRKVDKPARVPAFAGGTWRRMSPLSRLVASACAPLLEGREDLDTLPVIWGTALGELGPTERFLGRLFTEGPERASPLAFQNSVYNAPAGHLSIGLGLKGPSETVSGGAASGLAALGRGIELIELGASAVLVVAGDDITATYAKGFEVNGRSDPLGEAVVALLLTPDRGVEVELVDALEPLADAPVFARSRALPCEAPLPALRTTELEPVLGSTTCLGLVALTALVNAGARGSVVGVDGASVTTARTPG